MHQSVRPSPIFLAIVGLTVFGAVLAYWDGADPGALAYVAVFIFVIAGWVTGKITGARHSEPTILHAAITWLVATPILVTMLAAGAGTAFGGWYGGLIASPIGAAVASTASPDIVRNTAMAAVTSLLLGLIGSVIGGWMASGEPMTFTFYRKRNAYLEAQKGKVSV